MKQPIFLFLFTMATNSLEAQTIPVFPVKKSEPVKAKPAIANRRNSNSHALDSQYKNETLFFIDNSHITAGEFLDAYYRNKEQNDSGNQIKNYLNLYIIFKLKIYYGTQNKLDTVSSLKEEGEYYKKTIVDDYNSKTARPKISVNDLLLPPEIAADLKRFNEGNLLFYLMSTKVWDLAKDETGLNAYYNNNKTAYQDKDYNSIKETVMADYTIYLENEWLKGLRAKYSIHLNENTWEKVLKDQGKIY